MQEVIRRKNILWHIIKFVTCIALIISTFYYGFEYFNKVFKNEDVNYGERFHNMPENSVDIIVLGSSHAQYSFVPPYAYQDTGLYSYVLGTACQPLKVSYQMLREALKTQSPELVILEVFTATPQRSSCMEDSCYVIAEYQMRGEEKYNTIDYLPEEKANEYKNDFLNYHNNWKNRESLFDFAVEEDKELDHAFGYLYMNMNMPPDNVWHANTFNERVDVELDEDDLNALNNIYELCEENDMKLLLYMMPIDNLDVENQSYKEKVWEWADEHEVNHVDFIEMSEELDFWMQVHSDGYHSTISGAGFVTDYLCDFIKENYEFDSHNETEYLNDAYSKQIDNLNVGFLNNEYDASKYLRRLVGTKGTIVIRYPGSYYYNEELDNLLKEIGVSENYHYSSPYYCVIKDGAIIDESDSYLDTYIDNHHIEVLPDMIGFDLDIIDKNSGFSIAFFNEGYGANVVKDINMSRLWDIDYDEYYQRIR